MEELERRLRSALTELAEEVPPSHNAWAEHERRLAFKSPRARVRPGLLAAVAAAVVALIAVPVIIFNLRPSGVDQAAIPTSETSVSAPASSAVVVDSDRYIPVAGERLVTAPYVVGAVDKGNGVYWDILAYTVHRDSSNTVDLCTISIPRFAQINGSEQGGRSKPDQCVQLRPSSKKLVWYQGFVPGGLGAYLYVAAPQVESILVRRGENDSYRQAYRIGECQDFAVLLVNLNSSLPPKNYTARNRQMQDLENG